MTKSENRCSYCGGKFGLFCHYQWGLRFCRKTCKDNFLAKTAKDHACMRPWFGFLPRRAASSESTTFAREQILARIPAASVRAFAAGTCRSAPALDGPPV